jgi:hypothetical protein
MPALAVLALINARKIDSFDGKLLTDLSALHAEAPQGIRSVKPSPALKAPWGSVLARNLH